MTNARTLPISLTLMAALLLASVPTSIYAGARKEAVRAVFPQAAQIKEQMLFLSSKEQERASRLANAPVSSGLVTVYRAKGPQGQLLGYGFIDSRTVRTKTATFLVAIRPDGTIRHVKILGWGEPPEYRPGTRWLAQFKGHGLEPHTSLGREIQGMSGASFTSSTLTDGVRRLLAVYRVKLAEAN